MASFIQGSIILNINGNDLELKGQLVSGQPVTLPSKLPALVVGFSKPIASAFSLGTLSGLNNSLQSLLDSLGVTEVATTDIVNAINSLPVLGNAISNADFLVTDVVVDTRDGARKFLFGIGVLFNGGTTIANAITVKALGVRISKNFGPTDVQALIDQGLIN